MDAAPSTGSEDAEAAAPDAAPLPEWFICDSCGYAMGGLPVLLCPDCAWPSDAKAVGAQQAMRESVTSWRTEGAARHLRRWLILVGGFGVVAVLVPGGIAFVGFWWVGVV